MHADQLIAVSIAVNTLAIVIPEYYDRYILGVCGALMSDPSTFLHDLLESLVNNRAIKIDRERLRGLTNSCVRTLIAECELFVKL